jgi:hypothetical protein
MKQVEELLKVIFVEEKGDEEKLIQRSLYALSAGDLRGSAEIVKNSLRVTIDARGFALELTREARKITLRVDDIFDQLHLANTLFCSFPNRNNKGVPEDTHLYGQAMATLVNTLKLWRDFSSQDMKEERRKAYAYSLSVRLALFKSDVGFRIEPSISEAEFVEKIYGAQAHAIIIVLEGLGYDKERAEFWSQLRDMSLNAAAPSDNSEFDFGSLD